MGFVQEHVPYRYLLIMEVCEIPVFFQCRDWHAGAHAAAATIADAVTLSMSLMRLTTGRIEFRHSSLTNCRLAVKFSTIL